MRSLGKPQTETNLREMFKNVDANNDGTVNFEEFLKMMRPKTENTKRDSMKEVFRLVDKNSDGLISAEEVKHVVKMLGKNLTDSEIAKMMKEADRDDRDGQITYDEFDKFVAKLFKCHR